jgi:hypothetical protein
MISFTFTAQLKTLRYRPTNLLAGLNLNIPVNTREYFRLTDFWVTLYIPPLHPIILLERSCAVKVNVNYREYEARTPESLS